MTTNTLPATKVCRVCDKRKKRNTDNFYAKPTAADGLDGRCKACHRSTTLAHNNSRYATDPKYRKARRAAVKARYETQRAKAAAYDALTSAN